MEKWFRTKKYSILPISQGFVIRLHISQPQREGDGRQASVVPPLYPVPAASLNPSDNQLLRLLILASCAFLSIVGIRCEERNLRLDEMSSLCGKRMNHNSLDLVKDQGQFRRALPTQPEMRDLPRDIW